MQSPNPLAYDEVSEHLRIRIRAHTEYANFTLEQWFSEHLHIPTGGTLLEVGCGDGNWFQTWSTALGPEGFIVGIDKNEVLLERAAGREVSCGLELKRLDFNDLDELPEASFDAVVAPFSIYYADDANQIMAALHRLARQGGRVTLVGPTARNAAELYQLNALVFGFESDDRTQARAQRIETEFRAVAEALFSEVKVQLVPRRIEFPSVAHYLEYFQATLLFRESIKEAGWRPDAAQLSAAGWQGHTLSKEVVVLEAIK